MARKKPAAKTRNEGVQPLRNASPKPKGRLIKSAADIESLPPGPPQQLAPIAKNDGLPAAVKHDIRSCELESKLADSTRGFNEWIAESAKDLAPSYSPGPGGFDLSHLADAVAAEGIMPQAEFMSLPIAEIPKRIRNAGKIRHDKLDGIAKCVAAAITLVSYEDRRALDWLNVKKSGQNNEVPAGEFQDFLLSIGYGAGSLIERFEARGWIKHVTWVSMYGTMTHVYQVADSAVAALRTLDTTGTVREKSTSEAARSDDDDTNGWVETTPQKLREALGISRGTLNNRIDDGTIRARRITTKRLRVHPEDARSAVETKNFRSAK